jgi:hypothetical protein
MFDNGERMSCLDLILHGLLDDGSERLVPHASQVTLQTNNHYLPTLALHGYYGYWTVLS